MALWKRAGIYYVKLTSPDGTLLRRSLGTTDRKKAEEAHDRLKAQLWDLAHLKKKPKRTWDEAALRWLKEKAHKKSYRDDVTRIRWFTRHLRGRTLDQVSRELIDRLISRGLAKRSDRTKDMYVALIRAIFRRAMREWEWIETMPAFRTYARGCKVRVRYLTHSQAEAVLAKLPVHQREVVLFALATGLRQRNILDLTWDRVDLERRIATIGEGDTKNGEAIGVPLNDIALGVLERQLGKHRSHVVHVQGKTPAYGEHESLARRIEGVRDQGFPLARSAAHLGDVAPAERRAHLGPSGAGGLEVRDDGAALRAHVGQTPRAFCAQADFSGQSRRSGGNRRKAESQKWSQWGASKAPTRGK